MTLMTCPLVVIAAGRLKDDGMAAVSEKGGSDGLGGRRGRICPGGWHGGTVRRSRVHGTR